MLLFIITITQWLHDILPNNLTNIIKNSFIPGHLIYIITLGFLITYFNFFYSNIILNINDITDNLKKNNTFIVNIRPGINTSIFIRQTIFKLNIISSIYLLTISLIPEIITIILKTTTYFYGTSILIIVIIIIDFIYNIQTLLVSNKYNIMIKKSKLRGH